MTDDKQYGCLLASSFNGTTYATLEDTTEKTQLAALRTAYANWKNGTQPLAIFSVDMGNGQMEFLYNSVQIERWCEEQRDADQDNGLDDKGRSQDARDRAHFERGAL